LACFHPIGGKKVSINSSKDALLTILLAASLIATLSLTISITLQTASADNSPENFTIVVLPDTQYYSQSYPWIFEDQTEWIIQNENAQNIVFVAHMGDIVNTADSIPQWENADNAMSILDNKVPYGILPGNHDLQDEGTNYSLYFPSSRYENYLYWGGSYSNNKNNYQLFSAGGMNFIALNLQYNPPADVLSWADNVLENYSSRRAIISTHSYLNLDGTLTSDGGTNIYNNVVVSENNVFLVLCGHNHGEVMRSDSLDNNRVVYQILADYQDYSNGGNGYLRIMKFVPAENNIYVKTYSPYLDNYMTGSSSQFVLTYPLPAPVESGWLYRRQITISPLNPENFQIKVLIPADMPKSDYPSIRFFENENSGALPYWIERCDNGSNTTVYENVVWVRRLENDDNTIWMYYHNLTATSKENGDNVFLFFDDFGGGTGSGGHGALNPSKWGPSGTGVDVYQTTLRLEDYSNNDGFVEHGPGQGITAVEENTKRIIEFRIKNSSTWRGGVSLSGPSNGKLEAWGIYQNSGDKFFSNGHYGSIVLPNDVWYIGNIIFYGDNATNKNLIKSVLYYGNDNTSYRQMLENDLPNIQDNWAPGASNTIDKYKPWVWDSGGSSSYYYDWFFVREWAATEPIATVGPQESAYGVTVSISPPSQNGGNGATLIYTVTINNTGNASDNYSLIAIDNASPSWNPSISPTSLVVPAFGSDNATLSVTIPPATIGTVDNIAVTANGTGDSDSASCTATAGAAGPPVTGTASIRMSGTGSTSPPFLWSISKVNATTNLTIYQGDNLHLIFLAQDNKTVESDMVIWSRTAPGAENVTLTNLVVPHDNSLTWPAGGSPSIAFAMPAGNVKRVKVVLTDSAGNVIVDNMAWYRVVQDDWSNRISWIILKWGNHNSPQQDQLSNEISSIIINWGSTPTSRDQYDYSQL
jgi:hypothetical protein